jgi:oligopeptide transport system substrate-binding protein
LEKDAGKVGVRALSDRVLEVRLKRPVVYFPSITTFMVTAPLRRDIIEQYGDHWTEPAHIVTNGPFLLDTWQHEYKLVLKANPHHWAGPPSVHRIELFLVRDPSTELTLYETGELDLASLPPVAIDQYRTHPDFRKLPLLRGYYYGFNVEKKPFADPRVRRALAHAIDRSQIPLILKGEERPTASWIPRGMFAYNEGIGPKFDPGTAQRLLAEAGYPGGRGFPAFSISYNTDPANQLVAQFVQAQWKKHLGLNLVLEEMEWKVFLSRLNLDPPPVYRLGWGADFPDPDNFMNLFTSTSGNNHTRWKNPEYDRLVAEAAAERDPEKRRKLYDRAQRILTETDVPIISLFVTTKNMLVKPRVHGFKLNAMELLYLNRVKLKG